MESSTANTVVRSSPGAEAVPGRKITANEPFSALRSRAALAFGASSTERRTQITSSAGSAPVQNITRQARSSSRKEKTIV